MKVKQHNYVNFLATGKEQIIILNLKIFSNFLYNLNYYFTKIILNNI